MSELRHDPLHRRWVIFTDQAERLVRERAAPPAPSAALPCPFCEGNEHLTPSEVEAVRSNGSGRNNPGWRVRVVPHEAALLTSTPETARDVERHAVGAYERLAPFGAHEVIIEAPRHLTSMADLAAEQLQLVFLVYRRRLGELLADDRIRYVQLFKNHGAAAGGHHAHTHTQLVALPVVPRTVWIELRSGFDYQKTTQRCLSLDLIQQERDCGERVVAERDGFVAYVPYAARFPCELWVTPTRLQAEFTSLGDDQLAALADLVGDLLRRLRACLDDPPYNLLLFTAPRARARSEDSPYWRSLPHIFHWHLEIVPRLTQATGFELGSGLSVNPWLPEAAARLLRECRPT